MITTKIWRTKQGWNYHNGLRNKAKIEILLCFKKGECDSQYNELSKTVNKMSNRFKQDNQHDVSEDDRQELRDRKRKNRCVMRRDLSSASKNDFKIMFYRIVEQPNSFLSNKSKTILDVATVNRHMWNGDGQMVRFVWQMMFQFILFFSS